jgi:hypothetical protein
VQVIGVPDAQAPLWQVSAPLQAFPSEQLVPFATAACVHWPPVPQVSAVQGLPSSQLTPDVVQVPAWQVPGPHRLGDVHVVPSATFVNAQPVLASHEPTRHGLSLWQSRAVPGLQTPA